MGSFIGKPITPLDDSLKTELLHSSQTASLLNLENRLLTSDILARVSAHSHLTKSILSLSLAHNRLTYLVFQDANVKNSWPMLENLDLSGNGELFVYEGMLTLADTLKTLKIANNSVLKVPKEVWALTSLTKLDLSRNRLLTVPSAIEHLEKLHTLKLSHNNLSSLPEELKSCPRLRRLDLSHNRYVELPVNDSNQRRNHDRKRREQQREKGEREREREREKNFFWQLQNAESRATLPTTPRRQQPTNGQMIHTNATQANTPVSARTAQLALANSSPTQSGSLVLTTTATAFSSASLSSAVLSSAHYPPSAARAPVAGSSVGINSSSASSAFASSDSNLNSSLSPDLQRGSRMNDRSDRTDRDDPHAQAAIQSHGQAPVPIRYLDPARVSYLHVTTLNLSNNMLESLSPSIGLLRSLNSLNLGYNRLRSLPTEIALLTELKYLDLRFNSLPSLLPEICSLPRLSKLSLQNNKITSLPYEIKKLTKLTHFFISSNHLVDIPDTVKDLVSMRALKICNNRLLTVPDSLFVLQKLRVLDLSYNKLTFISPLVCEMRSLADLRLWGNKIEYIPLPVLHAQVHILIQYLKATEKERREMYTQIRYLTQAPRAKMNVERNFGMQQRPSQKMVDGQMQAKATNSARRGDPSPATAYGSGMERDVRHGRVAPDKGNGRRKRREHKFAPVGFYDSDSDSFSDLAECDSDDDVFQTNPRGNAANSNGNRNASFTAIDQIVTDAKASKYQHITKNDNTHSAQPDSKFAFGRAPTYPPPLTDDANRHDHNRVQNHHRRPSVSSSFGGMRRSRPPRSLSATSPALLITNGVQQQNDANNGSANTPLAGNGVSAPGVVTDSIERIGNSVEAVSPYSSPLHSSRRGDARSVSPPFPHGSRTWYASSSMPVNASSHTYGAGVHHAPMPAKGESLSETLSRQLSRSTSTSFSSDMLKQPSASKNKKMSSQKDAHTSASNNHTRPSFHSSNRIVPATDGTLYVDDPHSASFNRPNSASIQSGGSRNAAIPPTSSAAHAIGIADGALQLHSNNSSANNSSRIVRQAFVQSVTGMSSSGHVLSQQYANATNATSISTGQPSTPSNSNSKFNFAPATLQRTVNTAPPPPSQSCSKGTNTATSAALSSTSTSTGIATLLRYEDADDDEQRRMAMWDEQSRKTMEARAGRTTRLG